MRHGACIHYTGLSMGPNYREKCCGAGINYFDTFNGRQVGIFLRMPCVEAHEKRADGKPGTCFKPGEKTILIPVDRNGETAIPCPHRQEPTEEQIQQHRQESEQSFAKTFAALKLAAEWRIVPKPNEDRTKVVECPVCKGKLHLFQFSRNGHCHGKCETEGRVSWIE